MVISHTGDIARIPNPNPPEEEDLRNTKIKGSEEDLIMTIKITSNNHKKYNFIPNSLSDLPTVLDLMKISKQ